MFEQMFCIAPKMFELFFLYPNFLNKSLVLHPTCLNKSLALHPNFLNKSLASHPKCLNKSLALHPKFLNKSLALITRHGMARLCVPVLHFGHHLHSHSQSKYCTILIIYTRAHCLHSCNQNVWTKVLLCTQNVWTRVLVSYLKMLGQMSSFASKAFEQNTQNVGTKGLLLKHHKHLNKSLALCHNG